MSSALNLECQVCGYIWLAERPGPDASIYRVHCPRCAARRGLRTRSKPLPIKPPPWLTDPEPKHWITLTEAAEGVFRKSAKYLRSEIALGQWGDALPSYFDGFKWWVRVEKLPQEMERKEAVR